MTRRTFVSLAALALAIGAVACSKKDESGGVNVDVGGGGGGQQPIVISSGSSQVQIGTADLPETFPSEFPLPDDAKPVYSFSDSSGVFVWFSSAMSLDDLKSFFEGGLPGNGWTVNNTFSMSGTDGDVVSYDISGNGWSGMLVLGQGGEAVGFTGDFAFYVSLSVESSPSPTST
jgi:hypothetical protein